MEDNIRYTKNIPCNHVYLKFSGFHTLMWVYIGLSRKRCRNWGTFWCPCYDQLGL